MLSTPYSLLNPVIFRAYDIRGIAGNTLTDETVFLIGKAIGSLVQEQGGRAMYIARDGRLSGLPFSQALAKGVLSTGCDVIHLGMVPTPLLYYATQVFGGQSGVMLTGSHNPAEYNGLKITIQGVALTEEGIQSLYHRIVRRQFLQGQGKESEFNIISRYQHDVLQNIQLQRPLKIIIDAGSGVAGMIAPSLYRQLGCEVHELYCEIDGRFPFHHADPSDPKNLQDLIAAVCEQHADIGLAFDGDGDRLGIVAAGGDIIWPDRLLMLFAQAVLVQHPEAKIIYDVKCTHHLDSVIRALGGDPVMWKTGHSFIKRKMIETGAVLAGEMSGHFFFKDRWYGFDDALYAGGRLLEILSQQSSSSEVVFNAIPNSINTPELKVAVSEEDKFSLMQLLMDQAHFLDASIFAIDGLRVNFAEGWGLVRPSNTTPCLVMRFEAANEAILHNIQSLFREWMLSVKPDLVLPF
jgi:phosphomannomutase/phosphoglucomutase